MTRQLNNAHQQNGYLIWSTSGFKPELALRFTHKSAPTTFASIITPSSHCEKSGTCYSHGTGPCGTAGVALWDTASRRAEQLCCGCRPACRAPRTNGDSRSLRRGAPPAGYTTIARTHCDARRWPTRRRAHHYSIRRQRFAHSKDRATHNSEYEARAGAAVAMAKKKTEVKRILEWSKSCRGNQAGLSWTIRAASTCVVRNRVLTNQYHGCLEEFRREKWN